MPDGFQPLTQEELEDAERVFPDHLTLAAVARSALHYLVSEFVRARGWVKDDEFLLAQQRLTFERGRYEYWFKEAAHARGKVEEAREALEDICHALHGERQHGTGRSRGLDTALMRAQYAIGELEALASSSLAATEPEPR